MPLTPSDFPFEVQVAFFIYSMMRDVWDGMSGVYLGKDWSSADFLFKAYEVEDIKTVSYFLKMYEGLLVAAKHEESERKRKAEERKNSAGSGGKTFTHNVRG